MALLTKKIISILLTMLLIINTTAFSFAQNPDTADVEETVKEIKENQQKTEEKFAKVVGKADQIIESYKEAVAEKGEAYVKRNNSKIKKTLKKASNLKLRLIDVANEVLKKDLENKIGKQLEGEVSKNEIEQIKKEAEPNYLFELQEAPSDTLFGSQWGLQNIMSGNFDNKLSYTGEKVVVAVLDTGVNFSVPDLEGKEWKRETCSDSEGNDIPGGCMEGGYDFVDNDNDPFPTDGYSHGTHVAGIIGANTDNNEGIASIANENVEIMSLRACCGQGNFFGANNIAKAIRFAANNDADIINASFGGPTDSTEIKEAIEYANSKGVTLVAASGNYSSNNDQNPIYPANYNIPNIISVGAISNNENLSYFSNYGKDNVDIAAPGSLVYSLDTNGNYPAINGTSFATPFVASTLARYKSLNPSFSASELKDILFTNSIQNSKLEGYIGGGYQLKFPSETQSPLPNPLPQGEGELPLESPSIEGESGAIARQGEHQSSDLRDEYTKIMRSISKLRNGKISVNNQENNISLQGIKDLETELQTFIKSEKQQLKTIEGLGQEKIDSYINILEKQLDVISKYNQKINETTNSGSTTLSNLSPQDFENLSLSTLKELGVENQEPKIQILDDMSSFDFGDEDVQVENIENYEVIQSNISGSGITIFSAEENPVSLNDLQENSEIIIDESIRDLASELEYNPVKILDYVRENIVYEPYYGAKKTNIKCLEDRSCNDYDTSSLLISLLRASGIPARYTSSAILVKKDNIAKLLGTNDRDSVTNILGRSKVQPYTTSGDNENIIIDWTFVELLYEYDYRGGNFSNTQDFSSSEGDEELITRINEIGNLQWLPADATFDFSNSSNTLTLALSQGEREKSIVEISNIDVKDFFYTHLQSSNSSGVLDDFKNTIVETSTEVTSENIDSFVIQKEELNFGSLEFLPVSFPYTLIEGTGENGKVFEKKSFSNISEAQKQRITIKLKTSPQSSPLEGEEAEQVILEQSYFIQDIDNIPLDLEYVGATQADKDIIESYGSLHLTPSELVDIIPVLSPLPNPPLSGEGEEQVSVKIGDQLVLTFEYFINDTLENSNSKFSLAGNSEGIYLNFSEIPEDSMDTDSKVLLAGNWGISKRYLERVDMAGSSLAGLFGRSYTPVYTRAIVTQNRVLNPIDNAVTTFDFKGLSIDAYNYVNDYSLLPLPNPHLSGEGISDEAGFRMVYGLYASEQEGQIFNDITGLTGISTVKGLQFAYNNSDVYSVEKINSNNSSVIDGLNFSENTKDAMRQYIDEGKVIVTPNGSVQSEAWEGIVYVAVDESNGDGVYAIGEMVSNGGWTVDEVNYNIEGLDTDEGISDLEVDGEYFIFKQKKYSNTLCRIHKDTLESILNTSPTHNYDDHGLPCSFNEYKKKILYSNSVQEYDHKFIYATKGGYFGSSNRPDGNYDYWMSEEEGFEADLDLGTYVKITNEPYIIKDIEIRHASVYNADIYNPKQNKIQKVKKNIYREYEKAENKILLGFPVAESIKVEGKTRELQVFENGGIYEYFNTSDKAFSKGIYITHGNWHRVFQNLGGYPIIGFPTTEIGTIGSNTYQKFEHKICTKKQGIITCDDRTNLDDITEGFQYTLESALDLYGVRQGELAYKKLVANDYEEFLSIVDTTSDGEKLCMLYYAYEHYDGISLIRSANGSSIPVSAFRCPGANVETYKAKKVEIQDALALHNETIEGLQSTVFAKQDKLKNLRGENFSMQEWAGFFAVEIVTLGYATRGKTLAGLKSLGKKLSDDIANTAGDLGTLQKMGVLSTFVPDTRGAVKALGKEATEEQIEFVVKQKVLSEYLKVKIPRIQNIDMKHINLRHKFGSQEDASKFLEGLDIEKIIKEAYNKKNKKIKETKSIDEITGKDVASIMIEAPMGRQIGEKTTMDKLTIIMDYEGNIFTAYPVKTFRIK